MLSYFIKWIIFIKVWKKDGLLCFNTWLCSRCSKRRSETSFEENDSCGGNDQKDLGRSEHTKTSYNQVGHANQRRRQSSYQITPILASHILSSTGYATLIHMISPRKANEFIIINLYSWSSRIIQIFFNSFKSRGFFIYCKMFSRGRESRTVAQTLESGPEGSNEHRGSICLGLSSYRGARN